VQLALEEVDVDAALSLRRPGGGPEVELIAGRVVLRSSDAEISLSVGDLRWLHVAGAPAVLAEVERRRGGRG
jgi:hypothetical protein